MRVEKDIKISRPVITSGAAADQNLLSWLKENAYHEVKDRDGALWSLSIEASIEKSPKRTTQRGWLAIISAKTEVNAENLVSTGVLDPEADRRLLSFLTDENVSLHLKPTKFHGPDEDAIKEWLLEALPRLKNQIETSDLGQIKRILLGRWIDQKCTFGKSTNE